MSIRKDADKLRATLSERNAEIERLEQLVADLVDALEPAVDDVDEARGVAQDLWNAMVELRRAWVADDDMLYAWNRVFVLGLPEYLRRWLRASA